MSRNVGWRCAATKFVWVSKPERTFSGSYRHEYGSDFFARFGVFRKRFSDGCATANRPKESSRLAFKWKFPSFNCKMPRVVGVGSLPPVRKFESEKKFQVTRAMGSGRGELLGKKGAKSKLHFICDNCGESYAQWWGSCKNCKEMNTLKEFREPLLSSGPRGGAAARAMERFSQTKQGAFLNESVPSLESRSWLANDAIRPRRLTDVSKGGSQLHWRLPLVNCL